MSNGTRRAVGRGVERRAVSSPSYNAETRTVEIVAATETPIRSPGWRIGIDGDYWEILDMSPGSVDLSNVEADNCPMLDSHNRWSMADRIGGCSSARLENRELIVVAGFGQSPLALQIEAETASGNPPPVSAGYRLDVVRFEGFNADDGLPIYRATRWALREVSFTPIAADLNTGVRSDDDYHPCTIIMETSVMTPEQLAAQAALEAAQRSLDAANLVAATRAAAHPAPAPAVVAAPAAAAPAAPVLAHPAPEQGLQARGLTGAEVLTAQTFARQHGVEAEITPILGRSDVTAASVNVAILEAAATRQASTAVPAGSAARAGPGESHAQGEAITEALAARMLGRAATGAGQQFRGWRASEMIALRMGITERDPNEILRRAMHTTTDFATLLTDASNRVLLGAYQQALPTYRMWAARRSFNDFRPTSFLRLGDFPELLDVAESGEIKSGSFATSSETVKLGTKGRIVSFSRQAIINDDLGGFGEMVAMAGRRAARTENTAAYALLAQNSGDGPKMADTVNMFHATHANKGTAGAPSVATLGLGRAAMAKQKGVGDEVLNLTPSIILSGPDIVTAVEQLLAPVNSTQASEVNPFSGKLTPVSDANITGNGWYLFAPPTDLPNFIYGYLGEAEAPTVTQSEPFSVDGVSLKVLHDWAIGQVDYRGGYRNAGA